MFKFPSVDLSQPSTDPEPHVAVVNDMTSDGYYTRQSKIV